MSVLIHPRPACPPKVSNLGQKLTRHPPGGRLGRLGVCSLINHNTLMLAILINMLKDMYKSLLSVTVPPNAAIAFLLLIRTATHTQ